MLLLSNANQKDTPNANEALRELLRRRLLCEQRSDLAPYDSASLSVPSSSCSAVPSMGLLNESDSQILSGVESGLLLSQADFEERVKAEGTIKPNIGPALRHRKEYTMFIKQLVEGGICWLLSAALSVQ
jgi:hypothetical protein